ncbi:hypothetical protein SLS64_014141 [Diaporthe eres]
MPSTQQIWAASGQLVFQYHLSKYGGSLFAIISRPWWSRLWTLQEVVAAPSDPSFDKRLVYRPPNATIVCGESQVQWHIFEELISVVQVRGLEDWLLATASPSDNTAAPPTDEDEDRHAFASLEEIRTCRRGNAGLGHLPISPPPRNPPAPRHPPRRHGDRPVGAAGQGHDQGAGPAVGPAGFSVEGGGRWAIPRSRLFHGKLLANILRGRDWARNLYNTDDPRQIQLVEWTDAIRLSGLAADEVAEVVDGDSSSSQQALSWHERCLALARRTLPEGADGFDALARTLIAGDWDLADPQPCAAPYLRLRQHLQAGEAAGTASPGILDPDVQRYAETLRRVTRRRRFFATKGGRIGLGPAHTEAGDAVAVAFYCPTPYILRRRGGEGEGRWGLVGEAYVHGIMYGEALRLFSEGRVEETSWVVE